MAVEFEKLKFTRDWNNSSDFPTYEENEQKVRADMQALHDETKEFINETLIPSIENLAVPGTGDMKAEVYDPWNKRKDVYQYAEDKIAEHLENDNHVDAFSKNESLSAETREALGLDESATPDDALKAAVDEVNRVAGLPALVMDVSTGKRSVIESEFVPDAYAPSLNFTGITVPDLPNAVTMVRSENFLLVAGKNSSASSKSWIFDMDNGTKTQTDFYLSTGDSNALQTPVFNLDRSTVARTSSYSGTDSYFMLDIKNKTMLKGSWSGSSSARYFVTDNYWGLTLEGSNTGFKVSYAPRGQTKTNTDVSLSSTTPYSGNYYNLIAGSTGDILWRLERSGDRQYRLSKIDLTTGTVTAGIAYYDFSYSTNYVLMRFVFATDTRSYFAVYEATSGKECDKLFWFDYATQETNYSEFSASSFVTRTDMQNALRYNYYLGTVGSKAYFCNDSPGVLAFFDKETGAISGYNIKNAVSAAQTGGMEVVFDIPELPGKIVCNGSIWDVVNGVVEKISGGREPVTVGTAQTVYARKNSVYHVAFCGRVTDADILGAYDYGTFIGKEGRRPVASVIPYEE